MGEPVKLPSQKLLIALVGALLVVIFYLTSLLIIPRKSEDASTLTPSSTLHVEDETWSISDEVTIPGFDEVETVTQYTHSTNKADVLVEGFTKNTPTANLLDQLFNNNIRVGAEETTRVVLFDNGNEGYVSDYITRSNEVFLELYLPDAVEMQISNDPNFTNVSWQPYTIVVPWTFPVDDGIYVLYIKYRTMSDNIISLNEAFTLDTTPPFGWIGVTPNVVGPDNWYTMHAYLDVMDKLSNEMEYRLSSTSDMTEGIWSSYQSNYIDVSGYAPARPMEEYELTDDDTIYIQYRDSAGNLSEVYSAQYLIDKAPPEVYAEIEDKVYTDPRRVIDIYAYDELSQLAYVYVTDDSWFIDRIQKYPYTDTIEWDLAPDEYVVWLMIEDSVGNKSEWYPVYAGETISVTPTVSQIEPSPTVVPTVTPNTNNPSALTPTIAPTPTVTVVPTVVNPVAPTDTPIPVPTITTEESETVKSTVSMINYVEGYILNRLGGFDSRVICKVEECGGNNVVRVFRLTDSHEYYVAVDEDSESVYFITLALDLNATEEEKDQIVDDFLEFVTSFNKPEGASLPPISDVTK